MSRRLLSALAVLAVLSVPPLSAAGLPRPEPAAARFSAEAPGSLFSWLRSLLGLQGKNGCRVDPNGYCLTGATPGPVTKNGCHADPNGGCGG